MDKFQVVGIDQSEILAAMVMLFPELPEVLERVKSRTTQTKRQIADYQAACLYVMVKQLAPKHILEIGTAYGFSAAVMAEAAPDATITTLNPVLEEVAAAVQSLHHYPRVNVLSEKSFDFIKKVEGQPYDFIFVDGDHKRVRVDLPFWDHLAPGGVMVFHDYSPAGTYRACPPVYEALNEFRKTIGQDFDVKIVDSGGVGMAGFRKQTADSSSNMVAGERGFDIAQAAANSILSFNHLSALYDLAAEVKNLKGCIVECGVTNGGSAAAIYAGARKTLKSPRKMYLYDTLRGIPEPDEYLDGAKALNKWESQQVKLGGWCKGSVESITAIMDTLKIDGAKVNVTEGLFADIADYAKPQEPIAFLHVDATLCRSTRQALETFFNQVESGGIVTVSAYGHWQGVQTATDAFFNNLGINAADLPRIDGVNLVYRKP